MADRFEDGTLCLDVAEVNGQEYVRLWLEMPEGQTKRVHLTAAEAELVAAKLAEAVGRLRSAFLPWGRARWN